MKRLTFKEFVSKAEGVHLSGLYLYPEQEFENTKTKIRIFCTIGNHEFHQLPSTHLLGKGCRSCTRIQTRKTFADFESQSKIKYGDRFTFPDRVYVNSYVKIKVICNACKSEFMQTPVTHLNLATGCLTCGYKQAKKNITKSFDSFVKKAVENHGDKYSFNEKDYSGRNKKTTIFCNRCQSSFKSKPNAIMNGRGCSSCSTHSVEPCKLGMVYKILSKTTGKVYVGITTTTMVSRLNRHIDAAKRGKNKTQFARDLLKYGRRDFLMIELEQGLAFQLGELESKWIDKLNSAEPYGYNVGPGGCGLQLKKRL